MKALRVSNRQSQRRVDVPLLRRAAKYLTDDCLGWGDYDLAICLIEPEAMARLNWDHLQHHGSTDVITFDYTETGGARAGEIFISVSDAIEFAARYDCAWQEEVARYVVHGLLHLAGFDDVRPALKRVMKRRENKLLKELSQRFDLRRLGRRKNG